MNIRYRVTLTVEERQQLQTLAGGGQGAVRQIKRAQILLAADARSHRRTDLRAPRASVRSRMMSWNAAARV
jgi:hypothetical protein